MNDININGIIFKPTYLENYYASSNGLIIQAYYDSNNIYLKKVLLMNQETMIGGYKRIQGPKHSKHHYVHRLVYSAWGKEPLDQNLIIDHIDANPSNNNISNLRQVSQKQNIQNAILNGNFGNNGNKKIRVYDILTNTHKDYNSVKEFLIDIGAPEYMVKHNSISGIYKRAEYNRYHVIEFPKGQTTIEMVRMINSNNRVE